MNKTIDIEPAHELSVRQPSEVAPPTPLDIGGMVRELFKTGKAGENAAALEKLLDVQIKMEDRQAVRMFNTAFVELQRDIPKIKAVKSVPDKQGHSKFRCCSFEEIDQQAKPFCLERGFTYTFSEAPPVQGKVGCICTLMHVSGHHSDHLFYVRLLGGPPGATENQCDMSSAKYAQRGALCHALCINIDRALDADPHNEGGFVSADIAFELERRAKEANCKTDVFLRLGQANLTAKNPWATILAKHYLELDAMLRKKEGK